MSLFPLGPDGWPEIPPDLESTSATPKADRSASSWLWSLSLHVLLFLVLTILFDPAGGGHPGPTGKSQSGAIGRVISAVFLPTQKSSSGSASTVDTRIPEVDPVNPATWTPSKRQVEQVTFRTVEPKPSPEEQPPLEPESPHSEPISQETEPGSRPRPSTSDRDTVVSRGSDATNERGPNSPTRIDDESQSPIPTGPANPQSGGKNVVHGTRKNAANGTPSTQAGGRRGTPGTSFFGVQGNGKKFVYVIDCSASMSERQTFAHARQELLASLELLPATALIQVIYYNDQPLAVAGGRHPALVRNTAAERRRIAQASQGVVVGGGTMHLPALELALQLDPDVIYWLTDADDPLLTDVEMRQFRRENGRRIPVHAIEFGFGPKLGVDNFLKRVSRESGGWHQYCDLSAGSVTAP